MKSFLTLSLWASCLTGVASFASVSRHCLPFLQTTTTTTTTRLQASGKGFGATPEPPKKKEKVTTSSEEPSNPVAAVPAPAPAPPNAGQRALAEMRRQQAEKKNQELNKVREMLEADRQVEQQAAAIPERVAQRMGARMLPFVGLPLLGGMGCFVAFWYFATYKDMEFQPALVAGSTIAILVVSLLVRACLVENGRYFDCVGFCIIHLEADLFVSFFHCILVTFLFLSLVVVVVVIISQQNHTNQNRSLPIPSCLLRGTKIAKAVPWAWTNFNAIWKTSRKAWAVRGKMPSCGIV